MSVHDDRQQAERLEDDLAHVDSDQPFGFDSIDDAIDFIRDHPIPWDRVVATAQRSYPADFADGIERADIDEPADIRVTRRQPTIHHPRRRLAMTDQTAHLTAALEREGVKLRPYLDMRCCRCGFDQSWSEDCRVLDTGHLLCADCAAALSRRSMNIRSRTEHITQLARIVAAEQGDPAEGALLVIFRGNNVKLNAVCTFDCCGTTFDWGEAQWHALAKGERAICCPDCLPGEIERGEAIRDDWSALETLAYMLGGRDAGPEFLRYFSDRDW
jgi:hypothetical protein